MYNKRKTYAYLLRFKRPKVTEKEEVADVKLLYSFLNSMQVE